MTLSSRDGERFSDVLETLLGIHEDKLGLVLPLREPLVTRVGVRHLGIMTSAEARRHDLYNGFAEVFGQERADTLMTYLSTTESDQIATKSDIAALGDRLDRRMDELTATVAELSRRVDRVLFALIAGLVAIVATLISQL